MPVDLSSIDAYAFFSRYTSFNSKPVRDGKRSETQYYGSCPWCPSSKNSFMFTLDGRWSHAIPGRSGCGRHGSDVLSFLQQWEGITFHEACDLLGVDSSSYVRSNRRSADSADSVSTLAPSTKWQEQGKAFVTLSEKILWHTEIGHKVLQWLFSRGLEEWVIRKARLGYSPLNNEGRWYSETRKEWGLPEEYDAKGRLKPVWLYEGVVIPWFMGNDLWKINIRRLRKMKPGDAKYMQISGSSEGLYNVDSLNADRPCVLCESELDALSGVQACGDLASFVATGSTARGRRDIWIAHLSMPTHLLIAYDDDVNDAGNKAASYWTSTIANAMQWLPWEHDINDMLKAKMDICEWLELGIATSELALVEFAESEIVENHHDEYTYDEELPECELATEEEEDTDLLQVIEESEEYKKLVQFGQAVNSIAAIFPDGCLIEKADPTISLLDYVRSLRKPYSPVSLDPLPRKQCPHHVLTSNWKRTRCTGKTLDHGWCEQHKGSQLLLELGARLGWPEANYSQHVFIAAGLVQWECFAENASERDLRLALPFLKRMIDMENSR